MSKASGKEAFSDKDRLRLAILLALIALVCVSAASVAWFTIADFTKVQSMSMEITAGSNLRFDLDPHDSFEDYVKTLTFKQIAKRVQTDKGFDMKVTPLDPVTTDNYQIFTFRDGTIVESTSGAYLEFTLHFMATSDMLVHLTSANTDSKNQDGTLVSSSNEALPDAMRISFTVGNQTYVYDPGAEKTIKTQNVKVFGLPTADKMVLNDDNAMFWLKKDVNQPVIVHIWLEGTDPLCDDHLRNADYSIKMRFIGTDAEHNVLDGSNH